MWCLGFDFGSVYGKGALLDEQGRLRHSFYRKRGHGEPEALEGFLRELEERWPGLRVRLGVTGEHGPRPLDSKATLTHGLLALCAGVRASQDSARAIIEVGGQTAKYLTLDPDGGLAEFATNEACAAGTGSFLEQQARRLELSAPELGALALTARRAATVAGRCSVFAASDMIHLQQKGTPLAEIAYGLCAAIARNFLSTLLKGRELAAPVVLAGGCARNPGIVRAFRDMLEAPAGAVLVSEQPGLEGAIGAAVGAAGPAISLGEARNLLASLGAEPHQTGTAHPPLRPVPASGLEAPTALPAAGSEAYLGVDVGSVSTDLVLVDPAGGLLASVYLPTRGRPADVLLEGLALLRQQVGGRVRVLGCGATGSGRYLAGRLVGADVVKNEITCQLLGAKRYIPDVDTILEIGGQDSKFILVRDGAMADFTMNKVCAAGTGSFLEERSRDLGIEIRGEFAARAFAAEAPLDLGARCTVFMETEIVNAMARGASVENICGGLAHAIVKNYLDKVVGTRPLGRRIVFQGGVASNAAVVSAFEQALGRPVQVHPYNRISGAIGAALAAQAAVTGPSCFKGFGVAEPPRLSSFECQHCSNRCEVNVIETGAGRAYFGDTCERYTSGETARACRVPDLAEEYLERCRALLAEGPSSGLRIGLPLASSVIGLLPFWVTFWQQLGHQPVLSEPSSQETLALGLKHLSVGVCLPVKLTAGHVHGLLAAGVDRVCVPSVVQLPGEVPSRSFACPYTMALPFIIDVPADGRCLTPVVSFQSEEAFSAGFDPYRDQLGVTRDGVRAAFRMAMAAHEAVLGAMRRRARELLEAGAYRHAFAILGRPYSLLDRFVNLGLFERLRRRDVLALPMAFLPAPERPAAEGLPWRYPDLGWRAAASLAEGAIHPVILSSYGCGPDAFALQRMREALGRRPQLVLELDEHRGEAGLVTRVEAFLDQLDGAVPEVRPRPDPKGTELGLPLEPSTIWIPYFADHAYAYSGLLRHIGHEARVLPLPGPEIQALGERYALGKECHAYAMLLGDLLHLAEQERDPAVFFFPGTSIPCLLQEYGRGMQSLLSELGIRGLRVSSPNGQAFLQTVGLKAVERFYSGLLAIELLVKAVCQIRPYERVAGATDLQHRENLERIEGAVAAGDVLEALDESLRRLARIPLFPERNRPTVGLVGDLYTRVNPVANQDLVRWLEQQGLEVWPSPFQIDLLDFDLSRNVFRSLTALDLPAMLATGSMALLRAIHLWRVRAVVGGRVARREEPGYLELKRLAAPYMPNEDQELLFLQVAKTVDFAQRGANGVANAICFGCMVGNAAAAVNERIRKDFDHLPILTAVYTGGEDPARRLALEAFVSQVKAHHRRQQRVEPVAALDWIK
jgi:predicted CoA-substrate-specific enzyme activase